MVIGAVFGICVGLVLGLTGAGGGMLAIPALVLGLGWTLPQAAPVALLAVGVAAMIGAVDGVRKGLVRWRAALLMAACGIAFSPIGVHISHLLPANILMTLFALAMLAAAARLVFDKGPSDTGGMGPLVMKNCMLNMDTGRLRWDGRCASTLGIVGVASGLLTGMLGVAGGFMLVPAFKQWTNIKMHGIVATSLAVVALVSLGTAISSIMRGVEITSTGGLFIAAAMCGMVCGRLLAPSLSPRTLQVGFAILSSTVAVYLLVRTW